MPFQRNSPRGLRLTHCIPYSRIIDDQEDLNVPLGLAIL